MAQPKNKKRRSRKRARTARSGGPGVRPDDAAPTPKAAREPKQRLTTAQRAQKARDARAAAGPRTAKANRSEAPKPMWAPLPITEGLILVGLIGAATGLVAKNTGLVLGGFAMIVISSLELALREHLAGYRSHTTLISTVAAMAVVGGAVAILNATGVGLPQWPLILIAIVVFAVVFRTMRQMFKDRSGGLSYRV